MAKRKNRARRRLSNGCLGCLGVLFLLALIVAWMGSGNRRDQGEVPTLAVLPSASPSPVPPTSTSTPYPTWTPSPMQTSPTLSDRDRFATAQAEVAPLEPQVRALDGVKDVMLVSQVGQIVGLELWVEPGYKTAAFAGQLFEMAQRVVGEMEEFSVILDDGGVPISYQWTARRGWSSTELSFVATARVTVFPTLPPAQPPTNVPLSVAPTRTRVVSPYTCNGVDDLNCSDFPRDGRSAQAHLEMCGNEDRLDGDDDGDACEFSGWLENKKRPSLPSRQASQ